MTKAKTFRVVFSYVVTEEVCVDARNEKEARTEFWQGNSSYPCDTVQSDVVIKKVEEVKV